MEVVLAGARVCVKFLESSACSRLVCSRVPMFRCDLDYGMDGINFGEIGLWKEECGFGFDCGFGCDFGCGFGCPVKKDLVQLYEISEDSVLVNFVKLVKILSEQWKR